MAGMTEVTTRSRIAGAVALIVTFLAGITALALAVHVAFVILDADPQDRMVEFFQRLADRLALGFKDLVSLDNVKVQVAVNYGLAVLFYLITGQVVSRLIRKVE
jgi:hypothetical protein